MKQTQMPIFLISPDEINNLLKGFPVGFTPTNGMKPFLLGLDAAPVPPAAPINKGYTATPIDKGYTVHRRAPGKGKGRFECKCGVTADTLSRLFKHQKRAHP